MSPTGNSAYPPFNCPTILKGVGIVFLKRQKNGSYVSGDYDLDIGGNKVVIDDLKHTYNGKKSGVNNITGMKERSVRFIMGDATLRIGGNATGVVMQVVRKRSRAVAG